MQRLSTNEEAVITDLIYKKILEFIPELRNNFDLLDIIESELFPEMMEQIYNRFN